MDPQTWQNVIQINRSPPSQEEIDRVTQLAEQAQHTQGFLNFLINFYASSSDPYAQVFTATQIKKNIINFWENDELYFNPEEPHENLKDSIKAKLLELLIRTSTIPPPYCISAARLLALCVGTISKSDYPQKWRDLMEKLIDPLNQPEIIDNPIVLYAILNAASQVFKRYEVDLRSDFLYQSVNRSIALWDAPTLQILRVILPQVIAKNGFNSMIEEMYSFTFQIICSLCNSELPQYFLENLPNYFQVFINLLTEFSSPTIVCEICNLLKHFIYRFINEIVKWGQPDSSYPLPPEQADQIQSFNQLWNSLLRILLQMTLTFFTNENIKSNDKEQMVVAVLQPLSALAKSNERTFFLQEGVLNLLFHNVIVPAITLTEEENDMFNEEPFIFFQKEAQGETLQSKRKAAITFLKLLCRFFRERLTETASQFYSESKALFEQNPNEGWIRMDTAIYILSSILAKTTKIFDGVVEIAENCAALLTDFISGFLLQRFSLEDPFPVLQMDALIFFVDFRNVLPIELITGAFTEIPKLLVSKHQTIRFFAAYCIEKMLTIHTQQFQITPEFLSQFNLSDLVKQLTTSFTYKVNTSTGESLRLNEIAARCLMKLISLSAELFTQFAPPILDQVYRMIDALIKNPENSSQDTPNFPHYMFELVAASVSRLSVPVQEVESHIIPKLQVILQQDILEYVPYVFQLLSVFLLRSEEPSPFYTEQFGNFLLNSELWKPFGNIPALTMLVQSYCQRLPHLVLENALTFYQICNVLLPRTLSNQYAFSILLVMVKYLDQSWVLSQIPSIIELISAPHSPDIIKYRQNYAIFLANLASIVGPANLIPVLNSQVYAVWGDDLQYVRGRIPLENASLGVLMTLCDSDVLFSSNREGWEYLFVGIINMLESPSKDILAEEMKIIDEEKEQAQEFDTTFSKLVYVPVLPERIHPEMENINLLEFMATKLAEWSHSHPGLLSQIVQAKLQPHIQKSFEYYEKNFSLSFS